MVKSPAADRGSGDELLDLGGDLVIGADRRIFDQVHQRLRAAIVSGRIEAGSRLVERNLTGLLHVSRTPIREALRRLEQEGLVVCYPHRGYYVRNPSHEEARQAYEMRRTVEGLAGTLAAQRITDDELHAMRESARRGRQLLKKGDRRQLLVENERLHLLQATAARNMFLEQQLRAIWAYVNLVRGTFWTGTDRPLSGADEHEAIIDALARRDSDLARRLNEQHVDRAWASIERRFTKT